MKIVIHNELQLDTATKQIWQDFQNKGELNIEWGEVYKDKTLAQQGYLFGGLVSSIKDWYAQNGDKYTEEEIKENFYNAVSYLDEEFKRKCKRFNGEEYIVPLRISQMDRQQMSKFITHCLWLIDNAPNFKGLVLHPSLRNTWIRHLTPEEVREIQFSNFNTRDKEYMQHVRNQSCLVCGTSQNIEAHHLRIDNKGGTAIKPPDYMCQPLCNSCHREYHIKGHKWFEEQVKYITRYVDLTSFCLCCYNKFLNHL